MAVSALSITTLGALSSPAEASPAGDRAVNASATWLKAQLQGGVLQGSFGPEVGPSIDAGLAFDSLGRAADAATVADGIAPHLVTTANYEYGYARSTEYDFGTGDEIQVGRYANATAKAAAFAVRIGRDPSTAYADIDLITQLEELTSDTTGLIADDSSFGNFANSIGQAFAVEALTATQSPEAAAATAGLLQQQCEAGNFRFDLHTTACAGTDIVDTDQTSLAILSLLSSGVTTAPVTQSVRNAAAWLAGQQASDGSFGAGGDNGPNANSTGLAAWALSQTGNAAASTKAGAWLRAVQVADIAPCVTTLTAENGAVAPKPSALAAARTAGTIAAGQRITYAFATAQALPALASVPAGTGPLALSAPATAVEKSTVTITVAGLGAGEAGCVSFGSLAKPVTGTGGDVTVTFDLPAGAAAHTFTLTTLAGAQSATTNATLTPRPTVGKLKSSRVEKVKHNKIKLAVTCDATEACDGKIAVRTTRKVKVGNAKKAKKVLIAKKSYSVEPGETEKVVLKVRKPARVALAGGRVKVKAVQTAPGADKAVTKFWLRRQ